MRQLFRVARTTFCGAMVASPRRCLQQGGIGAVSDGPPQVFNRHVKRLQRDAAAARGDCELLFCGCKISSAAGDTDVVARVGINRDCLQLVAAAMKKTSKRPRDEEEG